MRIYLAGPMRGYPKFNFPAFRDAAIWLRAQGHEVFNPAERDEQAYGAGFADANAKGDVDHATRHSGFSLREALAADMAYIANEAEALYMLVGWEASSGARAEHALAQALGLPIFYQASLETESAVERLLH